jgi:V/A-type H+-transporting ATPase subunit F
MTKKIAVIGEKDFILPFKGMGVDIYPIEREEEARNLVRGLDLEGYGIIFITEDLCPGLEEIFVEFREKAMPALIPIPLSPVSSGYALTEMGTYIKKALGWEII